MVLAGGYNDPAELIQALAAAERSISKEHVSQPTIKHPLLGAQISKIKACSGCQELVSLQDECVPILQVGLVGAQHLQLVVLYRVNRQCRCILKHARDTCPALGPDLCSVS